MGISWNHCGFHYPFKRGVVQLVEKQRKAKNIHASFEQPQQRNPKPQQTERASLQRIKPTRPGFAKVNITVR